METNIFLEVGVILGIATAMALLMRLLKQPLVIGHILTGVLVGPVFLNILEATEILSFLGQIGIAFLLFLVGISLNPKVLKDFGRVSLVTGIGQMIFATAAGILICIGLGFGLTASIYISAALSLSSTIIVLKILSDKGDMEQLYAKIAIGFLLVQDFIAILLLFALPMLSDSGSALDIFILVLAGVLVSAAVFLIAFKILPHFDVFLSRSQELLFLFANAWGIGVAAIFWKIGFSLESGALIAGIGLSVLPFRHEVAARLAPLRDFFLVLFFILLGAQMVLADVSSHWLSILIMSALVLIGKPLILMTILGAMGYRKKTSLLTGLTVAQISEFSLILIALGVRLEHIPKEVLSIVTVVGLITIFGSTYLMLYSGKIYRELSPFLRIFERKKLKEKRMRHRDHDVFLFGGSRVGFDFIELFKKTKKDFVVVDYDPDIVRALSKDKVPTEYGDASDVDLLEDLRLESASLVVSTIANLETNILILHASRRDSPRAMIMVVAHSIKDAMTLYEAGVDYVILPHFLGAKYASHLTERYLDDLKAFRSLREDHLAHLKVRVAKGHDHPVWEHGPI